MHFIFFISRLLPVVLASSDVMHFWFLRLVLRFLKYVLPATYIYLTVFVAFFILMNEFVGSREKHACVQLWKIEFYLSLHYKLN
jgi:hypothetical protein